MHRQLVAEMASYLASVKTVIGGSYSRKLHNMQEGW